MALLDGSCNLVVCLTVFPEAVYYFENLVQKLYWLQSLVLSVLTVSRPTHFRAWCWLVIFFLWTQDHFSVVKRHKIAPELTSVTCHWKKSCYDSARQVKVYIITALLKVFEWAILHCSSSVFLRFKLFIWISDLFILNSHAQPTCQIALLQIEMRSPRLCVDVNFCN